MGHPVVSFVCKGIRRRGGGLLPSVPYRSGGTYAGGTKEGGIGGMSYEGEKKGSFSCSCFAPSGVVVF